MISAQQFVSLDPQVQQLLQNLQAEHDAQLRAKDALIAQREHDAAFKQAVIDKLTHEVAVLKRLKFAATSERFASTLAPEQRSLLEETLDSDLAELEQEINPLGLDTRSADDEKKKAKRKALPPDLPRRDVSHEPAPPPVAVAAAARCNALAKTYPRSWTTSPACSR